MTIQGLSAIGTQPIYPPATGPAAGRPPNSPQTDFGGVIRGAVDSVNAQQAESATSVQQLLGGATRDVLPVIQAVAKADMSFRLLIAVRNKVIEAYKQTMSMPL